MSDVQPKQLLPNQPIPISPGLKAVQSAPTLTEDYRHSPPASFGQRVISVLLDFFFIAMLNKLVMVAFSQVSGTQINLLTAFILSFSVQFCYWVLPTFASGQTIGKKLIGIKVVSDKEDPELSLGQVICREFIGKGLSSVFLGFGYLMAITNEERKTLHDKFFKTRVIKVKNGSDLA